MTLASPEPAFVKFDFSSCEFCEKLDPFWNQLGEAYPNLLYRVDCSNAPDVCEARSVFDEHRGMPVFKFWTGSSFRRLRTLVETGAADSAQRPALPPPFARAAPACSHGQPWQLHGPIRGRAKTGSAMHSGMRASCSPRRSSTISRRS